MKVLHVNQQSGSGGASGICLALHKALIASGYDSRMLVGRQKNEQPGIGLIDNDGYRSRWGEFWMGVAKQINGYSGRVRGAQRLSDRWIPYLASPRKFWSWWAGQEDYDFPGTRHLLAQSPLRPDILHLHNLHGDYFDLRELPQLSKLLPTVVTLHDAWLLAGHCVHFLDCQQWLTGCRSCPYLTLNRSIRRDGAAYNWSLKQRIYQHSKLHVVCPSRWLSDKVSSSILNSGVLSAHVIPNGIDTNIFKKESKVFAKEALGLPKDSLMVLFFAETYDNSTVWPFIRDSVTLRDAVESVAKLSLSKKVIFCSVGIGNRVRKEGNSSIMSLPNQETPAAMAKVYQAADVYLHSMCADNYPTCILESLACGTPVVASAVGGIPEQIQHGITGFLISARDVNAFTVHILELLNQDDLRIAMGQASAFDAEKRFGLENMVSRYRSLYEQVGKE